MRPPQSLTIASKQIMKRILVYIISTAVVLTALAGVHTLQAQQQRIQLKSLELSNTANKLKRVQEQYEKVNNDKNSTDKQVEDLNKQIEELNKQLSAKKAAQAASIAAATLNTVKTAQAASVDVSGSDAMSFIFAKESGGNPGAVNASSGACGLGQALPCSKLTSVCSLSDVGCQTAFFTNYANSRYGGWQGAKEFWLSHGWY